MGLYRGFPLTINNHMKILSLNEGLKIMEDRQLFLVQVNVDSKEIISMSIKGNLYYNTIIDDCRSQLRRIEISVVSRCCRE